MRVLFLYQDLNLPSSRVRVINLVPYLQRLGVTCDVRPYPRRWAEKVAMLRAARQCDTVFLQRKLVTLPDLALLRFRSKRLVFDFDDAIYQHDDLAQSSYSRTRSGRFHRIVKAADLVTAGNCVLEQQAKRFNRAVAVIPSAVPATTVPVKDYSVQNRPRIGWVGTEGNLRYLAELSPVLHQLAQEIDFELVVLSNQSFACGGVKVVNKQWQLHAQEGEIARFDVGVMPLADTSWTRGKCGYKALQYMAAGVPAVCSDVGANAIMIRDGSNGYKPSTAEAFYAPLKRLLVDASHRQSLGIAARQTVLDSYSLEVVAKRLTMSLGTAVEGSQPRKNNSHAVKPLGSMDALTP